MNWKPVVAGIDGSPESAVAATVALKFANAADTECHLIHGSRPVSAMPVPIVPRMEAMAVLNEQLVNHLRLDMKSALRMHVSPDLFEEFEVEVRLGDSNWALAEAIHDFQAGLLVLGGKHHSTIGRWLGGSTAHHAVRSIDVPILITTSHPRPPTRVLVGIDFSHAAEPALREAQRLATLFGSELRVLHTVEPFPLLTSLSFHLDESAYYQESGDVFDSIVSDSIYTTKAERVIRQGPASSVLREECASWKADLLVVGTHGRGWIERTLIGSTTNTLLNDLPTSLLVVPGGKQ